MSNALTLGGTYHLGGYDWVVAEQFENYAVLQSTGVTAGAWAGYALTSDYEGTTSFGNANAVYSSDIDGLNIANYNNIMTTLYDSIKDLEYTSASYGKGLFLVANTKCGATTHGAQGSGYYWEALKIAATNYKSFGSINNAAWLGTVRSVTAAAWSVFFSNNAHRINYEYAQNANFVIAPAFNLDLSAIRVDSNNNIKKTNINPTVNMALVSSPIKYDGNTYELLATHTTTGGTLKYKVNNGEYTTNAPTAILPGKYTIYYKVEGDEEYNDMPETLLGTVAIEAVVKQITPTDSEAAYDIHDIRIPTPQTEGTFLKSDFTWAVIEGSTGVGTASTVRATLTASGWSDKSQTVTVTGMTSSTINVVGLSDTATAAQREACANASLAVTGQDTNSLTIVADGIVPSVDMPILVIMFDPSSGSGGNGIAPENVYTKDEIDDAIIELTSAIESKQNTLSNNPATLLASGWVTVGDTTSQTVTVNGLTADTVGSVGIAPTATAAQREAERNAILVPTSQSTNTLTIVCDGVIPTVDIPISILM